VVFWGVSLVTTITKTTRVKCPLNLQLYELLKIFLKLYGLYCTIYPLAEWRQMRLKTIIAGFGVI